MYIPASKQTLAVVISVIVIIGGVVQIIRHAMKSKTPETSAAAGLSYYRSVGYGAAEETIPLVGKQGQIVVAGLGANEAYPELAAAILRDFKGTLKNHGSLTVAGVETVTYEGSHGVHPGFPGEEYLAILAKYPTAAAAVSFASFPELTSQQIRQLPEPRPFLVVVAPRPYPGLKSLLAAGVIDKAIITRFTAPPIPADQARTAREWFDLQWQIATPEMAASLPD